MELSDWRNFILSLPTAVLFDFMCQMIVGVIDEDDYSKSLDDHNSVFVLIDILHSLIE